MQLRERSLPGVLLYGVLLLAALCFAQGLGGTFLFDDFENLEDLQWIAADPSLGTALQYIASGFTGPSGRPLSLATFALQFFSWPDHAADFLYVNTLLHVLNGALLYWALLKLQRVTPFMRGADWFPLAATALWLLTPVHTATVLYAVQRMAILAGTFMLAGTLLYLAGREQLAQGRDLRGFGLMTAGVAAGLGLGVLSKENAVLFTLLLLVLEWTVLAGLPRPRAWRWWAAAALAVPLLAVLGVLATRLPQYWSEVDRSFNLAERLMTEARVLFSYLRKFLFPTLYGARLYYDDVEISRALWSPWTTLPAVAAWIALVAGAVVLRRRAAPFSLAVLWYLGGHALESTVVPLEIAFDHRNYVPLVGPAVAVAWYGLALLRDPRWVRLRPLAWAGAVGYGVLVGAALWQSASLWGRPMELMHYWGQVQPDSRRSQIAAAKVLWKVGQPERALAVYERAAARWPGDPMFLLTMLELGCAHPELPMPDAERVRGATRAFDGHVASVVNMLDAIVSAAEERKCSRYAPIQLWNVMEALFEVPAIAEHRQNHLLFESRIAELAGDRGPARAFLDEAISAAPRVVLLVQATAWSLAARDFTRARSYLDRARSDPGIEAMERAAYARDLDSLEVELQRLAPAADRAPP